ncbi:hypothetical protein [Paenibacillus sp. JJ-223]|uniref:hypothetical protein n=1 Tax=Paenibacillus sp. JJ-223 TaxID=2905647 RepID=UPI001F1F2DB2|nr:hypothetical protein [Paenibacillus sp. JJ-223]
MNRLKDKGFAHKHAMWPLDGAGHDLRPPYYSTTGWGSRQIWYGGSAAEEHIPITD